MDGARRGGLKAARGQGVSSESLGARDPKEVCTHPQALLQWALPEPRGRVPATTGAHGTMDRHREQAPSTARDSKAPHHPQEQGEPAVSGRRGDAHAAGGGARKPFDPDPASTTSKGGILVWLS